jgi:hypothetical protein
VPDLTSFAEVALLLGLAMPLTAVQILWINLITGTAPVQVFDGLLIVGIGAVFFALIEIEKQIRLGLRS